MEIVEGEQVNPSQSLAQTAAKQIQYLLNQKVIDQSFVKTVLENKENLHKIFFGIESITRISYLL